MPLSELPGRRNLPGLVRLNFRYITQEESRVNFFLRSDVALQASRGKG